MDEGRRNEIEHGPFDGHLRPGKKPALLLVDMVKAYLDEESPLFCETAAEALERAARLLRVARAASRTVVFTNVIYEKGGANGGLFYRKVPALRLFEEGSPYAEFLEGLRPEHNEIVVTKQYPSAFFETGLAETLLDRGVDTLIIAGYSTSGCVRASALDAMQHGFAPFIARDACADRHRETHEGNLFDLEAKYAEVIDAEQSAELLSAR